MYRILVVYYSQSGQLGDITMSVTRTLREQKDIEIVYEELKPRPAFPFPWTSEEFFQAFPESVEGIPCLLEPFKAADNGEYDLVMVAYQPWFLSPSIPVHAFFQHSRAKAILAGKPVIIITGCRNMWVMSTERIKQYIRDAGGKPVGNIVLYDKAPNLLSVISIMRWMFTGKKERYGLIPPAGVSSQDTENASKYGDIIYSSIKKANLDSLQENLTKAGAVNVIPELILFERNGSRFFKIWSKFILKKGGYGSKARSARLAAFKYYLLAVLFILSPFGSLFFRIAKPFRRKAMEKQKTLYQSMF